MRLLALFLIIITFSCLAQESQVQVIPPGCTSVTVPATPTTAGKVTVTCPKLTITTPINLPKAFQNFAYTANLAVLAQPSGGWCPTGFSGCYSYQLNSTPTPPPWLKLSSAGMITGTPTVTGTVNFSFTVTDQGPTLISAAKGSLDVAEYPNTASGR